MTVEAEWGAPYPKFSSKVARWRKLPRTPENVARHFAALMDELRRLNAPPEAAFRPVAQCVSGTFESDGRKILACINAKNKAKLTRAITDEHRARKPRQVMRAYEALMKAKRGEHTPDADRLVADF